MTSSSIGMLVKSESKGIFERLILFVPEGLCPQPQNPGPDYNSPMLMGSVLYTKRGKVTDTTLPATEIKDLLLF